METWPFYLEMDKKVKTDVQEMLEKAVDIVIDQPFKFEITINPQSRLHALLQQWNILPTKRVLELKPITLGNLLRISKLLVDIQFDNKPELTKLANSHRAIAEHLDTVVEVCAIAIHNRKSVPPEWLKSLIKANLSSVELVRLLAMVLTKMSVENFIASIILIKGMNVLADPSASATSAEKIEMSL